MEGRVTGTVRTIMMASILVGLCFIIITHSTKKRIISIGLELMPPSNEKLVTKLQKYISNESECRDLASDAYGGQNSWEQFLCEEDCQNLVRLRSQFQTLISKGIQKTNFFARMSYPVKSGCKKLTRIAGRWIDNKAYDGDKMVCLDDFPNGKDCLVYAFGLSNDWDFETVMANRGCKVYAFDHTVKDRNISGVNFKAYGISGKNKGKMKTFRAILQENDHLNATVTYFKFDVEGAEVEGLPTWIQDGSLDNVLQVGGEFHLGSVYRYAKIVLGLDALGFKLISHASNEVWGEKGGNYQYMEVLFRRTTICKGLL